MGLFYVICRMKKIAIVFSLAILVFGCKDEFNLPDYGTIEDTENPTISIISPVKNQTYSGLTQIPIQVNFNDDYQLDEVQFQLSPINFASPSFSITKKAGEKSFSIDTIYTVPSTDSIVYDVLIVVNDAVNNISTESYQFTTKN